MWFIAEPFLPVGWFVGKIQGIKKKKNKENITELQLPCSRTRKQRVSFENIIWCISVHFFSIKIFFLISKITTKEIKLKLKEIISNYWELWQGNGSNKVNGILPTIQLLQVWRLVHFLQNLRHTLLTTLNPLTVWITISRGKLWQRWEY